MSTCGARRLARTGPVLVAAAVVAAACGSVEADRPTGVAAPPIDAGAAASQTAVRLRPPGPSVGGCTVLPADNAWNTDVSSAPRHPHSDAIIARIQAIGGDVVHPDFGGRGQSGIPVTVVPPDQPLVPIVYQTYGDESDPGPFPIPPDAAIEGGPSSDGDRHVLVVRTGECVLYELYRAFPAAGGAWHADSGARWDLSSNATRPLGWTSADAAGLAILPGLVRYDEVVGGEIRHALRVTFARTRRGFIAPATHFASSDTDPTLPPMGMRLRLRSDYDLSGLHGQALVVARALQRYGLIVADNGSNWYVQGEVHPGWDDDDLRQLRAIPGTAFEVLDTGPVQTG